MKKTWKLVLCLALAVTMLSCAALAAGDGPEVAVNKTAYAALADNAVTVADGTVTVTVPASMITAGEQYVVVLVKPKTQADTAQALLSADYELGESTVTYIDQKQAPDSGNVTFSGKPLSMTSCLVLLGGKGANNEVINARVIGAIKTSGVSVKGKVSSYNKKNATTVTLTDAANASYSATIPAESATASGAQTQEFEVSGVPAGTYTLKVTKPGHLSYTVTGVVVADAEVDLSTSTKDYKLMTLLCADIDGNDRSTIQDLSAFRADYGKTTGNPLTDCDGNGRRTVQDLAAFRLGYGKRAPSVAY